MVTEFNPLLIHCAKELGFNGIVAFGCLLGKWTKLAVLVVQNSGASAPTEIV